MEWNGFECREFTFDGHDAEVEFELLKRGFYLCFIENDGSWGADSDLEVYIKPECGHHPHGLPDPEPIVDFIIRHS